MLKKVDPQKPALSWSIAFKRDAPSQRPLLDEAKGVGERLRSFRPERPTRRDFCRPRTGAPPRLDTVDS